MSCFNPSALLWAFYCVMFGAGCVSAGFVLLMFALALWRDLRALWTRPKPTVIPVRPNNVVSIGFRVNRRLHPQGFTAPN